MSDNEYDGDEGDTYDVFANEEDEPVLDEQTQEDAEQAEMEVVDATEGGTVGQTDVDNRVTTKYMTKYERARILGTRALQIRYVQRVSCGNHVGRSSTTWLFWARQYLPKEVPDGIVIPMSTVRALT